MPDLVFDDQPLVVLEADEDGSPRLKGQAVAFGAASRPSITDGRRYRFSGAPDNGMVGALAVREHDGQTPIGRVAEETTMRDGIQVTVPLLETTAGRDAHAENEAGVRTGFSVKFDVIEASEADDGVIDVARWDVRHLGHVMNPAFGELTQAIAASTKEPGMPEATTPPDEAPAAATAPAAGPPSAAIAAARAVTRPVSAVAELAARITGAQLEGGQGRAAAVIQTIELALADITPAGNGAGNGDAGLAIQAMGELVDDSEYETLYESIVTGRPLTGAKITGWRWSVKPATGPYAGNKAEIPTNAATLDWVDKVPARIAGGHDIDRIYKDLGSAEMLASYWRIMALDVLQQYDDARLAAVVAAAGTATTVASTEEAVLAGLTAVKRATYVVIAQDLATAEGSKPVDTLPAAFATGNLFTGTIPSNIIISPDLTGQVLVGRRTAVDFFSLVPPVRLEALVVSKAGIDTGIYGYHGDLVAQLGGQKLYTVTAVLGTSRASK